MFNVGYQVILLLGLMGALRMAETFNVKVNDIERHGDKLLIVKIPTTKNKQRKSFTIQVQYLELVERYMALRPKGIATDKFFINYQNGKCICQPIGINKFRRLGMAILYRYIWISIFFSKYRLFLYRYFRCRSVLRERTKNKNIRTKERQIWGKSERTNERTNKKKIERTKNQRTNKNSTESIGTKEQEHSFPHVFRSVLVLNRFLLIFFLHL
jgi:hypothetical protein